MIGHGHQHARFQAHVVGHRNGGWIIHPSRTFDPRMRREKGGKFVRLVRHARHTVGFEYFEGTTYIQNTLDAGRYDNDGCFTQFQEIGRNIHGIFTIPMHPSNTPRDKGSNAGGVRNPHGGGDRCGPPLIVGRIAG